MRMRLALVALVLLAHMAATESPALCSTDTECAALCPADDAECDGGPQS